MNDLNNYICDLKSDNDTNKEDIAELQTDNSNRNNIEEVQQKRLTITYEYI
jgi:hypothetical protein